MCYLSHTSIGVLDSKKWFIVVCGKFWHSPIGLSSEQLLKTLVTYMVCG